MEVKQRPKLHRNWIHPDAIKITELLQKAGHETYLVGGCVRDLLSGIPPKDFDIATEAEPRQVKRAVPDAYIIGKRFRLVLAKRGDDLFEIATFRRESTDKDQEDEIHPEADNAFGTALEDAIRRDFTVNGLFYDPIGDKLVDYCDGLRDIECQTIRMIGDPDIRLLEDPIRILRAIRLAYKLDFSIEPSLRKSIVDNADSLNKSVLPRKREEILKVMRLLDPTGPLLEFYDLGVLKYLSPTLNEMFSNRNEIRDFMSYIKKIHSFVDDKENPLEIFGYLILSYYRSVVNKNIDAKLNTEELISQKMKDFFKNELGMYNVEQSLVAKAIELQPKLQKSEKFEAKKKEQKLHFLKMDAFPLALMFARADYSLSADKILYWEKTFEYFWPTIKQLRSSKGKKKKSYRKKRAPKKSTGSRRT